MNQPDMLQALRGIVGAEHVLSACDLSSYELDWRKRYRGKALAVVRPASTEQVAAVVRLCAQHDVSIVAQGGNTSTVGGAVPNESGQQVLLSMQRMHRVRHIDAANLTLTVEAGCILHKVQQSADQAGLLFPLSLASEGSCTIGGNLATNAGGTQVLRYGNARELCLGLEVVNAQGEIWAGLSGLRKDNTGYDLRDLFIGSEGTLGIITAATLRLFPRPTASITALVSCDNLSACVSVLQHMQAACGPELTGFEVMSRASLDLVRQHLPQVAVAVGLELSASPAWTALIEVASSHEQAIVQEHVESALHQLQTQGTASDVRIAHNLTQAHAMWHVREAIPLAQAEAGLNVKHDIALAVSAIPAFVAHVDGLIKQRWPEARLITFGHLGDGNLHYNVQAPEGGDAAGFLREHESALNELVFDAVMAQGGSIAAEHGIGQLRRTELARRKDPVALAMMRAVKQALDPAGLFNPGRLL
jgi:FAD/FMN-containing dehydrogenase